MPFALDTNALFCRLGPNWTELAVSCSETAEAIRAVYAAHEDTLPSDDTIAHAAAMITHYGVDGAPGFFWDKVGHPTSACLLHFKFGQQEMDPEGLARSFLRKADSAAHAAEYHERTSADFRAMGVRRRAAGNDDQVAVEHDSRANSNARCAEEARASEAAHRARAAALVPALAMAAE